MRTAYGRRVEGLSDAAVADAWATIPDDLADIEVHVHTSAVPCRPSPAFHDARAAAADWTRRVAAYPADGGPTGQAWLATVPGLLANALDTWRLVPDGPPMTGWTAIVVPVRRGGGSGWRSR